MDTERDENQNLKSDVDKSRSNSEGTEESLNQNRYDTEEVNHDHLEEHDYAEDQNNSNTGYTEKLLEKEFDEDQKKKDTEKDSDIEDDPIVKNGNIIDNENIEEIENVDLNNEILRKSNDQQ